MFLCFANTAAAQTVRVQNGMNQWGFGWMFTFGGNCYVALPEHVAGPLPKISVYTASPVVSDEATVQKPFWQDMDLAIAVVDRGALQSRCTATLEDLQATNRSRGSTQAWLHRVSESGEEERLPMQITRRGYLTLTAELTSEGDRIGQGSSGTMVYVGDTPIGLALEHDDPSRAEFLRAEEIAIHLSRYLTNRGFQFLSAELETPAAQRKQPGLPVRSINANLAPTLPQHGAENLLGDGLFVFRPDLPPQIDIRLDGADPVGLGRLRLSAASEGYSVPRDIVIQTDASEDGTRFRFWTQGQMTPDGVFDTGRLAPRNTRWVRILIRNSWSAGEVALDSVVLD